MKIDTHVHTLPSNPTAEILEKEGYRVKKVVDTAASKGLDAILLTDFNHIEGFRILHYNQKTGNKWLFNDEYEIKKQESSIIVHSSNYKKPLTVFLGEEIQTNQCEIIGALIKNHIEKNRGIEETIKRINDEGGIVIFPHPLISGGIGELELKKQFLKEYLKAIEVFNGQIPSLLSHLNKEAENIANKYKIFPVGGSDAPYLFKQYNRVGEVHTNFTNLSELSKEGIRDYVKDNCKTEIIGNCNNILDIASVMASKIFRKLKTKY